MPNTMHVGGYRIDLEDHAWLAANKMPADQLAMAMDTPFARPAEVDPRKFSPMDPQGQQNEGSCQGWAITAAGGLCYFGKTGEWKKFSPDAAYYLTQKLDNIRGDQGSTISGGMKMAVQTGFLPFEAMPYTPRYNPQDVPSNYAELAKDFKVSKYDLFTDNHYKKVVEWIGRGLGGCSWGINWNVQVTPDGFLQWQSGGGGGHANALLGYGGPNDSEGLPEYIWDKNSWGFWGPLKGWVKVKRSMFEKIVQHPHTVIVGISDMDQVKPRKVNFITDSVIQ